MPGTKEAEAGPLAHVLAPQEADSLLSHPRFTRRPFGEDAFPENGNALHSGPRWLARLPGPCKRRLCLPETRYPTRGAGGTHPSPGWRRKPSGCVDIRQTLREGFLALGETGADWTSSVKLIHPAEALVPCSVLLAEGTGAFTVVLRSEGRKACPGFLTSSRTRLFLSSPGRPARERQLGFRLVSRR